ncbi:hypothetical protein [Porphyromonas sp.]|uniref:hypothetical protein n=1 Tax=Porphyromonas sp. TaxID=1924944 RepID=UPI0026DD3C45|nr:hypothetical protein [Porphyromonas sp.]MDO4770406.1 hypothetical protein [Porphyromonas sp.]
MKHISALFMVLVSLLICACCTQSSDGDEAQSDKNDQSWAIFLNEKDLSAFTCTYASSQVDGDSSHLAAKTMALNKILIDLLPYIDTKREGTNINFVAISLCHEADEGKFVIKEIALVDFSKMPAEEVLPFAMTASESTLRSLGRNLENKNSGKVLISCEMGQKRYMSDEIDLEGDSRSALSFKIARFIATCIEERTDTRSKNFEIALTY